MLEFEFCEPTFRPCDCCDAIITTVTRFVTKDDEAYAIYYGQMSEGHDAKVMIGLVSLGEWWRDDVPACRVAFAFRLWEGEDRYNVGLMDVAESPWATAEIIGSKLSRDEALQHPWLDEVFHLTDHMTADDPVIREFFESDVVH